MNPLAGWIARKSLVCSWMIHKLHGNNPHTQFKCEQPTLFGNTRKVYVVKWSFQVAHYTWRVFLCDAFKPQATMYMHMGKYVICCFYMMFLSIPVQVSPVAKFLNIRSSLPTPPLCSLLPVCLEQHKNRCGHIGGTWRKTPEIKVYLTIS